MVKCWGQEVKGQGYAVNADYCTRRSMKNPLFDTVLLSGFHVLRSTYQYFPIIHSVIFNQIQVDNWCML